MSELTEWLALHRTQEGVMTRLDGDYFKAGRPVADFLVDPFECLIRNGLLALGRPDPRGWQRVCMTHSGQVRYAQLHSVALRTGMIIDEPG